MGSKRKQSITEVQASVANAIAGVQKNLSTTATITLAGAAETPATLLTNLQAYAPLVAALTAAHSQLHAAVLAEQAQRKQMISLLQALASFVTNLYGDDPTKLSDFGFLPKKKMGVESA